MLLPWVGTSSNNSHPATTGPVAVLSHAAGGGGSMNSRDQSRARPGACMPRVARRKDLEGLDGASVNVALAGQLSLVLLPPGRQTVEEAELVLRGPVEGHLVLVLASLLREGAHALVNPLVAVYLGLARAVAASAARSAVGNGRGSSGNDLVDLVLGRRVEIC